MDVLGKDVRIKIDCYNLATLWLDCIFFSYKVVPPVLV